MNFFSSVKRFFLGDPEPSHVPDITPEQIVRIKHLYARGDYTQAEIGRIFGVHQSQISRILSGDRH